MKNIILDLCGGTGAWSHPYKENGFDVQVISFPQYDVSKVFFSPYAIDFMPQQVDLGHKIIRYDDIYGIFAAPPCTMFSLARTTAKTRRDFEEGMKAVEACMQIIWNCRKYSKLGLAFWAMENPKGYLRQFMGKPAFTFDPSEFGADYNKSTDLWGWFKEPKKSNPYQRFDSTEKNTRKLPAIPEEYVRDPGMSLLQIKRSITNSKFAEAFYRANKNRI